MGLGGIIGGIFGGGAKSAPMPQPVAPAKVEPTLDELIGTDEERQKKAKLAFNAGAPGALGVTAPADVTRRNLLGV